MANNNDVLDYAGLVQLKTETDKRYLRKTTYEYNKEINFGSSGYLKIGSFPMYDSNITIDIDSTTNTTYHATIVIATQNVSASSIGSAHQVNVYGDASDNITSAIRVVWTSGSRNYNVYFVPPSWSKNFVHIRAGGMTNGDPTDICVAQEGTAPSSTSGLEATNLLKSNFQNTLVSGTNIKTINGNSVLGSGDLTITGGGDATWDFHAGTSWADCYSVASPNADDVNGYSIQIGGDGFTLDTGDINDNEWGGNNVFHAKNGYMGCAYDGWYFFSVNHNGSISVGDDSEGTSIFSAGNGWLYMYDGNEGVRGLDISVNSCSWYGYDIITTHNINGGGLTYDSTNKLLKHTNSVTAGTIGSSSASSGATLSVPYATYDANGHIKTKGTHTHTINAIKSYASRGSTGGTNRLDYDGLHIFIPYGEGSAQTSGRIGASSSSYTTFYGVAYGYLSVGTTATSTTYLYLVYRSSATGGWTTKTISWTGFSPYLMNVQVIRLVA